MKFASLDRLLSLPPFGGEPPVELLTQALADSLQCLRERFPRYASFLDRRSGTQPSPAIPALFLPILKQYPFALPESIEVVRTLTSSGTTGKPSLTPLDQASWDYRVAAMRECYSAMGLLAGEATALCFLMDPATTQMAGSVVIDAVLRSVPQVKGIHYLARMTPAGPQFEAEKAGRLLAETQSAGAVVLVGYPALIAAAILAFTKMGKSTYPLPPGSRILTGGGWKSFLPGLTLDREEFRVRAASFFGIPPTDIRDMYGLSESPSVFVECEAGNYHVPVWCLAQAIDPETGLDVPEGETGLLQLTCPLTLSYPLLKILTTDRVIARRNCPCRREAPYLIPRGRVSAARFETCAMKIGQAVA